MVLTLPVLILYMLTTAGLARLVTHSDLLAPVRFAWDDYIAPVLPWWLRRGIHCSQCVGAWAGLASGALVLGTTRALLLASWLAGGAIGSGVARLFAVMDAYCEGR